MMENENDLLKSVEAALKNTDDSNSEDGLDPGLIDVLIEQGQARGYLTIDDLLTVLPHPEENLDHLEVLLSQLRAADINIYDNADEVPDSDRDDSDDSELSLEEKERVKEILSGDNLDAYLWEISQTPLLSQSEEITLAKQIRAGKEAKQELSRNGSDPERRTELLELINLGDIAREKIIKANTRLVVSIAKRYRGMGQPFLDLVQEGNIGLMRAIEKFDYEKGFKFSTYATWWIRQAITRALAVHGRTIRLPVHMSESLRKLKLVSRRLEQDLGRRPNPEEISKDMDIPVRKIKWMLRVPSHTLSLERPIGEEEDSELGHFIPDDSAPVPPDMATQHVLREQLGIALSSLTAREERILRLRFGLHDGHCYTLEEVGQMFALTRERIRQLERKALSKLRHPRRSRPLKSYL